jgi:hypothetical protein
MILFVLFDHAGIPFSPENAAFAILGANMGSVD